MREVPFTGMQKIVTELVRYGTIDVLKKCVEFETAIMDRGFVIKKGIKMLKATDEELAYLKKEYEKLTVI